MAIIAKPASEKRYLCFSEVQQLYGIGREIVKRLRFSNASPAPSTHGVTNAVTISTVLKSEGEFSTAEATSSFSSNLTNNSRTGVLPEARIVQIFL